MPLKPLLKKVKSTHSKLLRRLFLKLKPNFQEYETSLERFSHTLQNQTQTLQNQLEEILTKQEELLQEPEFEEDLIDFSLPGDKDYLQQQRNLIKKKKKQLKKQLQPSYEEPLSYLSRLEIILNNKLKTYKSMISLTTEYYTQLQVTKAIYLTSKKLLKDSIIQLSNYLKQLRHLSENS